jgi:hypothetical protein
MDEWVDVDNKLPDEKMNCLVHYVHSYSNNDGFYAMGLVFYNGVSFQFDNISYRITHWMPLPEPPRTPKERGGEK